MQLFYLTIAVMTGYFCGAIPFGMMYVRYFTGKDLRRVGSGRMGGTNSLRAAGWGVGFLTSLSDVFKGAMSVWLTTLVVTNFFLAPIDPLLPWIQIAAGVAAVFGHNWSIFYGFRGGAGTGPNIGWACAIWFPVFPIGFVVMLSMIYFVGMASVASMAMALIIPISFGGLYFSGSLASAWAGDIVLSGTSAYLIGGLITAGIVAFALRGNFRRLLKGEERVVGLPAKLRQRQAQKTLPTNNRQNLAQH